MPSHSLLLLQGEFKSKADQAIQAGEQFCDLYYDILDTKRHVSMFEGVEKTWITLLVPAV